jgi:hypothetical protein
VQGKCELTVDTRKNTTSLKKNATTAIAIAMGASMTRRRRKRRSGGVPY